jgi:predicted Zn finger-like uncharacterized protein
MRFRPDITKYDLTFSCPECGYKIKPSEILRVDGERVRCPACKKDVLYSNCERIVPDSAAATQTARMNVNQLCGLLCYILNRSDYAEGIAPVEEDGYLYTAALECQPRSGQQHTYQ